MTRHLEELARPRARDDLALVRAGREGTYWLLLFVAADKLKDVDLMLSSATKAIALRPKDPIAINNFAAALIIACRDAAGQ